MATRVLFRIVFVHPAPETGPGGCASHSPEGPAGWVGAGLVGVGGRRAAAISWRMRARTSSSWTGPGAVADGSVGPGGSDTVSGSVDMASAAPN